LTTEEAWDPSHAQETNGYPYLGGTLE